MTVSFEPVLLDSVDDDEARLVLRDGRLAAIVSRLGDAHGELAGQWFVEAVFDRRTRGRATAFAALTEIEDWLDPAPDGQEPPPA